MVQVLGQETLNLVSMYCFKQILISCFPWYTVAGMVATSNSIISTDVRNAFSLLSTSSCPSNWHEESSSFDQFANGNNNISLAQPGISLELQNTTSNHLHDFHSFRSPHELDRYYSN